MTVPVAIRPAHFPYFPYEGFTFSLGRQDGDEAWLSGHSGATWDAARQKMVVGGSMAEQSGIMYEKIGTILAAAGLGFGNIVHVVENVTASGLDSYPDAEEVRRTVFGGREPSPRSSWTAWCAGRRSSRSRLPPTGAAAARSRSDRRPGGTGRC